MAPVLADDDGDDNEQQRRDSAGHADPPPSRRALEPPSWPPAPRIEDFALAMDLRCRDLDAASW